MDEMLEQQQQQQPLAYELDDLDPLLQQMIAPEPKLIIAEHPNQYSRFRYTNEIDNFQNNAGKNSIGSLLYGKNSTQSSPTYTTIELRLQPVATVRLFGCLVIPDRVLTLHPYKLIGTDCADGFYDKIITADQECTCIKLSKINIMKYKKTEIKQAIDKNIEMLGTAANNDYAHLLEQMKCAIEPLNVSEVPSKVQILFGLFSPYTGADGVNMYTLNDMTITDAVNDGKPPEFIVTDYNPKSAILDSRSPSPSTIWFELKDPLKKNDTVKACLIVKNGDASARVACNVFYTNGKLVKLHLPTVEEVKQHCEDERQLSSVLLTLQSTNSNSVVSELHSKPIDLTLSLSCYADPANGQPPRKQARPNQPSELEGLGKATLEWLLDQKLKPN